MAEDDLTNAWLVCRPANLGRYPGNKCSRGPFMRQPVLESLITLAMLVRDIFMCGDNLRSDDIIPANDKYSAFFLFRGVRREIPLLF